MATDLFDDAGGAFDDTRVLQPGEPCACEQDVGDLVIGEGYAERSVLGEDERFDDINPTQFIADREIKRARSRRRRY